MLCASDMSDKKLNAGVLFFYCYHSKLKHTYRFKASQIYFHTLL